MRISMLFLFFLPLAFMTNLPAMAQTAGSQWQVTPGLSLSDILMEDAEIISTENMVWPNGSVALIVYAQNKNSIFRCIDFYNAAFEPMGFECAYQLGKSDKKLWKR